MRTIESLQEAIRRERKQREAFSGTDWLTRIRAGHAQQALQDLIFFTTPEHFLSCVGLLQHEIRNKFEISSEEIQECDLRLLAELVLALCSFLPRWNLQSTERHGSAALTDAQLKTTADTFLSLIGELSVRAPALAEKLLVSWRAETLARLKAERAEDPSGEAQALVGNSIREYLANVGVALAHSHLRRMAEMRSVGETMTELSNDYATFLQYALYLGASFVTCNPPLIDIAWTTDPERWNPVVDEIIASHPDVDDDALARWVTLEIVLTNMRLLRPIFLLTEGRMGCVSLQVNPKKHGDAETMIRDAQSIYDELTNRLEGGVPNVVFKLPGTQAGLTACSTLTKQGIGVNITVNFALFQHLPFAQVIAEGRAIFSCLAHMSGRLAFPVRDELLAKLDELATCGISEAQARGAAAWSGVAVLKRLHRLLTERGYDLTRIKPLVASLRIYEGDGYERPFSQGHCSRTGGLRNR